MKTRSESGGVSCVSSQRCGKMQETSETVQQKGLRRMLDDNLLAEFAKTFYGYGNYDGHYWFVGMEEGGGNSSEEIAARLSVWNKRGRQELEDVAEFHRKISVGKYFESPPARAELQPTWNKLIRILLSAEGKLLSDKEDEAQTERVREYQRTSLGRTQGESCLIELLPLPSRSTRKKDWKYAKWTTLVQCVYRETYQDYYIPTRTRHIWERINQYKPRVVVFYSTSRDYRKWWEQIAGTSFSFDEASKVHTAHQYGTVFAIVDHPVRRWRNDYFHNAGQCIALERAKHCDEWGLSTEKSTSASFQRVQES